MRHHHLRLLLEGGGDDAQRNVLRDGVEGLQHVAAHVEVDLAGEQQRPAGDLRAALLDGDLEAAGGIGAVGDGLVVAAMLGLGEPVGAEGHRHREGAGRAGRSDGERRRGNLEKPVHRHHPLFALAQQARGIRHLGFRSKTHAIGSQP